MAVTKKKKSSGARARSRKITLIESDKPASAVRGATKGKQPVKVNLFVRAPDNVKSKSFAVAARLCGCRKICQAFVE